MTWLFVVHWLRSSPTGDIVGDPHRWRQLPAHAGDLAAVPNTGLAPGCEAGAVAPETQPTCVPVGAG